MVCCVLYRYYFIIVVVVNGVNFGSMPRNMTRNILGILEVFTCNCLCVKEM